MKLSIARSGPQQCVYAKTVDEIAEMTGLHREHVRRIERRALAKLRTLLVAKYGEDARDVL